jgi:hypothetical protein
VERESVAIVLLDVAGLEAHAEQGVEGAAGKFLGPVGAAAGGAAEAICKAEGHTQKERHATDPGLAVMVYASAGGAAYTTHTEVDSLTAVFGDEFVIPTEGIPTEGMLLAVVDRDGLGFERSAERCGSLRSDSSAHRALAGYWTSANRTIRSASWR